MSGKTKRRPIRPHERARVDQAMAAARDLAIQDPTAQYWVREYADPGIQCCWCDCTIEQIKRHRDTQCAGCPSDAVYLVHLLPDEGESGPYPLCERHTWGPALLYHEATGVSLEIHPFNTDAYDDDRP
jgi:hypothetical protein